MPKGTPSIKVRNVDRLGAKVVLHGADFDEAKGECARLAAAHGLIFVPPYDDPLVIAGQGTVGMEILKQLPDAEHLDAVFGAVGGGGLVAGICEYVKRIGSPRTHVIGVETFDGDAMARSLDKGERITLSEVGPFSDGTAVRMVGEEPFRICKQLLDKVVKVSNDEICAAIKDIFEGPLSRVEMNDSFLISGVCLLSFWGALAEIETRSVTEPAGALALAGLKRYILDNQLVGSGKKFAVVISGANMNFDRLRFVAERAALGEGREALLSVDIPERPGRCATYPLRHRRDRCISLLSFFALHTVIHPRQVTEFIYRYNAHDRAQVFLSFQLDTSSRAKEVASVLNELERGGMTGHDISDDEMAKSHARYLIGGASDVPNERMFRFGAIHSFSPSPPFSYRLVVLSNSNSTFCAPNSRVHCTLLMQHAHAQTNTHAPCTRK